MNTGKRCLTQLNKKKSRKSPVVGKARFVLLHLKKEIIALVEKSIERTKKQQQHPQQNR